MKAFYADTFVLPLPPGHKFPMAKYTLLRERLIQERVLEPSQLHLPRAATDEELGRAHDPEYVRRAREGLLTDSEMRRIGFPWSPGMIERSRRSAGGTIEAARAALEDGVGVNLAGGTHHAFRDRGEGFCVFNDAAVAARAMQAEGRARRVVVIDTDVHQGNGTAAIFRGDPTVFTFSIHGAKNFPYRKEQSDLDVALPDGTGDDAYLEALDRGLGEAIGRANADLAIFLSGADPHEGDRFGRLKLTKAGLRERDRRVFAAVRAAGLPVAVAMGGGYGRDVHDTVDVHVGTVREARG
ncbi:MAG TPA: histone deacetylase [Candidatus Polarisedimenticolaceae bacterium]